MTDDDFQIELGESVRRHIERRDRPDSSRRFFAAPYESPQNEKTPVFIVEKVMRAMEEHAAGRIECEVGGVLLGGFFQSDKGPFIEITDLIEATTAEGTDVSLTFTHETWAQIHAELAQRPAGTRIVGWYHSHPGLGVFLSSQDEFIHTSFFADPWHVAIVVDPIYHNWGCFRWENDALDQADGFYIFDAKKNAKTVKDYATSLDMARQATPVSASAAADRGLRAAQTAPLWAAIVVLLLAQIGTIMHILRTERITREKIRAAKETHYYEKALDLAEVSDLSGALLLVKLELATNPINESARSLRKDLLRVLADPTINQPELDEINFGLAVADKSDKAEVQWQAYEDKDKPYDDLKYDERLERAERVREALPQKEYAWYSQAVEWLQDEPKWRTIYHVRANPNNKDSILNDARSKGKLTEKQISEIKTELRAKTKRK